MQAGVTLNHIPFKGNSESLQAVLGGHVMSVADTPGWAPYVEQGKLRLLSTWRQALSQISRMCRHSRNRVST